MIKGIPRYLPADNFDRVYCHYYQIPWYILLVSIVTYILLLRTQNVNLDEGTEAA